MKERILLFGKDGLVGSNVFGELSKKFDTVAPSHHEVDVTNEALVRMVIHQTKPTVVINLTGSTNVDMAEQKYRQAYDLNAWAVGVMVKVTNDLAIHLIHFSTDYVFDGTKAGIPYNEQDQPKPLSVYGHSKRLGEQLLREYNPRHTILRIIMPYCANHSKKSDLVRLTLTKLQNGEAIPGVVDQNINPVFVGDIVCATEVILREKAYGTYHLGALDSTTPYDLMVKVARKFNLNAELIVPTTFEEFSKTRLAQRPKDSLLGTAKFRGDFGEGILHTVDEGVEIFHRQVVSSSLPSGSA